MKRYYPLIFTLAFTLSAMTIILLLSGILQTPKNGFIRKITPFKSVKVKEIDLKSNSYYINGLSEKIVYLGNTRAPHYLLSCTLDLNDTSTYRLPITYSKSLNWNYARVSVDSPNVYISEYSTPSFLSTSIPFKREHISDLKNLEVRFDLIEPFSPSSILIRGYHYKTSKKMLQKITLHPQKTYHNHYPLNSSQDDSFSVDGFMFFNRDQAKIFYFYYYRNQFVALDTNLKPLYSAKTIDTNSLAKVSAAEVDQGKFMMHAKPPLTVNRKGYSTGNWIYILSALSADNEDPRDFENYSVIDVYRLNDGSYDHSVKLANYRNKKMTDFAITGNTLIALFERYLVSYSFVN